MIGVLVQARMGSARLPGKSLLPLGGRPLLGHVLDRTRAASEPELVAVATSADLSDDPVAEFCAGEGVACERGALADVAARLVAAADALGLEAFARVNGDSPLIDPALIDRGVGLFRAAGPDLATNVHPRRTFPRGQSVEVIRTEALRIACDRMDDPGDREHVTAHFYAHPDDFRIVSFQGGADLGDVRLVVDTEEDAARIERVLGALGGRRAGYEEIARLAG